MKQRVHVIGYGSLLCGDDGVGVAVVRRLARKGIPRGVALFEGGVGGLATLPYFEGCRRAVVVDACLGGKAGTVLHLGWRPVALPFSLHGLGVPHILDTVHALAGDRSPEIVIVAVVIESARPGTEGLSAPVARAVDRAAAEVLAAAEAP